MSFIDFLPWALPLIGIIVAIKYFGASISSKGRKAPDEKVKKGRATPPPPLGRSVSVNYEEQIEQKLKSSASAKTYAYQPTRKFSAPSEPPQQVTQSSSEEPPTRPSRSQRKSSNPVSTGTKEAATSESHINKYDTASASDFSVEKVSDSNKPALSKATSESHSSCTASHLEDPNETTSDHSRTIVDKKGAVPVSPKECTESKFISKHALEPTLEPTAPHVDPSSLSSNATSSKPIVPVDILPKNVNETQILEQHLPDIISQGPSGRQKNSRKLASFPTMGVQKKSSELQTEIVNGEERCTSNMLPCTVLSAEGSSIEQSQHTQVRVLSLNHNEHLDTVLFRLKKGYTLQFRPGPSLLGRTVNVFTNYPEVVSEDFIRTKYHQLEWQSDSKDKSDDTALYVEVSIEKAGSFHFYFTYDDRDDYESAAGSGYFLVDPIIHRGPHNEVLPLDSIQCQTVMSKCLGPMNEWIDRLRVAYESGYNMIHFTPVQHLGKSRSGYSLADQHKLNPDFSTADRQYDMDDLEKLVSKINSEWKVVSLTDIVLNHTANESPWLVKHPECTYNLITSPHLRPAYLIDRALYHFSMEITGGKWAAKGIPKAVVKEEHVQAIQKVLFPEVFAKVCVEEFFQVNISELTAEFEKAIKGLTPNDHLEGRDERKYKIKVTQDPQFRRQKSTVSFEEAIDVFNIKWPGIEDEETRLKRSVEDFKKYLFHLNHCAREIIDGYLKDAVGCVIGTIRYDRLQSDGPKIPEVSAKHPLAPPYFTHYGADSTLKEEEEISFTKNACYVMAHNGWVMGDDPLSNFAEPGSNVYLKRKLVCWGDSVKLRYGDKPEDSEYLWKHMQEYVEETARIFCGIRLDNCHSTPIHVAEYLLECARRVRPDLYVIAELFTNSDNTDNIFVNRLGINSLIREAMSAPNSHEEGRLVYRYGGDPVGSFMLPPVRPLMPSVAHAILLDLTHDNKSPVEVRTGWDMLPSTALVNMACCATGSNRGYDEIVPHHIHVVNEERSYTSWMEEESPKRGHVNAKSGIIAGKKLLNQLHFELAEKGYNQVFVDQVTEHIVTVTRHNPVTHQSVVLVAYTAFKPPANIHHDYIKPLKVQGKFEEILFEINIKAKEKSDEKKTIPGTHAKDPHFVNGVNDFIVEIRKSLQPGQSSLVRQVSQVGADTTELEYKSAFRPGSVIAIRLSLLPVAEESVFKIRKVLGDFGYKKRISEVSTRNAELIDIVQKLSLSDLNRVLFRSAQEERDEGRGWGAYNVDNFGEFVYCGLQGIISAFGNIRVQNDLGHPICGNLRDGDWLLDYITGRLKVEKSTERLAEWLEDIFGDLKKIPRYLIPAYFDSIVTAVYLTLINRAWLSMGEFISQGSDFVKALGLGSVQFCGVVKSALLPPLSPNLTSPQPPTSTDSSGNTIQTSVTLAAGLPHFSTGYMRNWGRDTFIALPGNLLITGRAQEARWIIIAFAGTLRHGLIPNLLDGGFKSRFNCRDAVWFWLYSIQHYVHMIPNGHTIFKDKVSRIFPNDDSSPQSAGTHNQSLEDVIQEALKRHFQGVKFRERNAGPQIDSQMNDEGFNNEIGVDLKTGFPFGGNINNCGTWMDKMGSSEKAGNKGKPATPRDGSAVEIVGLCKAAVKFLHKMNAEGKFSYNGVEKEDSLGNTINWTYKFWEMKIADNFEKYFWINDTPVPEKEMRSDLINRRGIYKDVLGSSLAWTDYQFRCNFPIAIAAAPDLVDPEHAWIALENVEKVLLGPLGIKTLDPTDWKYRGDYNNADDSHDPTVARGFNYHQGPEWLWPVGWFLRAKLAIASRLGKDQLKETVNHVRSLLAAHLTHVLSSPWRSLPELTNSNGSYCRDSNPAQSWSTGCLLEVLWDINKVERELGAV